jgi:hypothetical protein
VYSTFRDIPSISLTILETGRCGTQTVCMCTRLFIEQLNNCLTPDPSVHDYTASSSVPTTQFRYAPNVVLFIHSLKPTIIAQLPTAQRNRISRWLKSCTFYCASPCSCSYPQCHQRASSKLPTTLTMDFTC